MSLDHEQLKVCRVCITTNTANNTGDNEPRLVNFVYDELRKQSRRSGIDIHNVQFSRLLGGEIVDCVVRVDANPRQSRVRGGLDELAHRHARTSVIVVMCTKETDADARACVNDYTEDSQRAASMLLADGRLRVQEATGAILRALVKRHR